MQRLTLKIAVYILLIKEGKILLARRFNASWQNGNYGVPAGHLEEGETIIEALLRETAEEVGVVLAPADVQFVHTMHRKSSYVDFYFLAKHWTGEPENREPTKCDDVQWFALDALPENMIPSVRFAIEKYQKGILFSEFESEE